jgi:hypothetical protein
MKSAGITGKCNEFNIPRPLKLSLVYELKRIKNIITGERKIFLSPVCFEKMR